MEESNFIRKTREEENNAVNVTNNNNYENNKNNNKFNNLNENQKSIDEEKNQSKNESLNNEKGQKKKNKRKKPEIPVYHTKKKMDDDTVTIKFTIHPRHLERFLYIIVIIILACLLIFKPTFLFGDCNSNKNISGASIKEIESLSSSENNHTNITTQEAEINQNATSNNQDDIIETESTINEEAEENNQKEEQNNNVAEKISASKISFEITDFEVIKKAENWYKIKKVTLKLKNNGPKLFPVVKIWYFDDATKNYFSTDRHVLGTQKFDLGIDSGKTQEIVFNIDNDIAPSFSGEDVNPTILTQLLNKKDGNKLLKEVRKKVTID